MNVPIHERPTSFKENERQHVKPSEDPGKPVLAFLSRTRYLLLAKIAAATAISTACAFGLIREQYLFPVSEANKTIGGVILFTVYLVFCTYLLVLGLLNLSMAVFRIFHLSLASGDLKLASWEELPGMLKEAVPENGAFDTLLKWKALPLGLAFGMIGIGITREYLTQESLLRKSEDRVLHEVASVRMDMARRLIANQYRIDTLLMAINRGKSTPDSLFSEMIQASRTKAAADSALALALANLKPDTQIVRNMVQMSDTAMARALSQYTDVNLATIKANSSVAQKLSQDVHVAIEKQSGALDRVAGLMVKQPRPQPRQIRWKAKDLINRDGKIRKPDSVTTQANPPKALGL